jgi:hypothetical protein
MRVSGFEQAKRLWMTKSTLCASGNDGFIGCAENPTVGEDVVAEIPRWLKGAKSLIGDSSNGGVAVLNSGTLAFVAPPTMLSRGEPVVLEASAIKNPVDFAGGEGFTCAVLGSGKVDCAVVREPTLKSPLGHVEVGRLNGIRDGAAISCNWGGLRFDCAIVTKSGHIVLFEASAVGTQLVADPFLNDVSQVSVGSGFQCALLESQQVMCSGYNDQGQLGSGNLESSPRYELNTGDRTKSIGPIVHGWLPVTGITDATSIAAGHNHACAATKDGRVFCWGGNDNQQVEPGQAPFTTRGVVVRGLELR